RDEVRVHERTAGNPQRREDGESIGSGTQWVPLLIDGVESARAVGEKKPIEQIQHIQGEVHHHYRSPRMSEELQRRGRHIGHNRIARIMRENALGPRLKKRFVLATRSEEGQKVAENLLDRRFEAPTANRV
ncbi:MAG: IS3 family transposase, partial [Spirochaetia bacterium]